jgi:hypothetical protein
LASRDGLLYDTKRISYRTKYPVSASGYYVDNGGQIVSSSDYEVIKAFEMEKRVEGPRHSSTKTTLKLDGDLDRLTEEAGGNAVTSLKIVGEEYNPGSHHSSTFGNVFGWSFTLVGAPFVVAGALTEGNYSKSFFAAGGACLGVGVLLFIAGA